MLGLKFYSKIEVVRAIVVNIYQYIFYIYIDSGLLTMKKAPHIIRRISPKLFSLL